MTATDQKRSTKFYRILLLKTGVYMSSYKSNAWQASKIAVVKKLARERAKTKGYHFSQVIIVEFDVDIMPKWYYLCEDELIPYEKLSKLLTALF